MKNIRFEESFVNGGYKEICEQNHEIIENKYFEIFGKEDYESKKEQVVKQLASRNKILKRETIQNVKDYLIILPYVRKQVLRYFQKQGNKVESIQQYLKLCQE